MKMSKEDRDQFVLENYEDMTGAQLVAFTGWSLTTIKSVKRRLGLQKKTDKVKELETYLMNTKEKDIAAIAIMFGMKQDNVRDTMKALEIFQTREDKAFNRLVLDYPEFTFGEYTNTKNKIILTCTSCGKIHNKRPNDLRTSKFTCPCNPNYHVYLIESNNYLKIGISKEVASRCYGIKFPEESHDNVRVWGRFREQEAKAVEHMVLGSMFRYLYSGDIKFSGYTETFAKSKVSRETLETRVNEVIAELLLQAA